MFVLDFGGVFGGVGWYGLGVFEILFVFLFVDLFDNLGMLVVVMKCVGLIEVDGWILWLNWILFIDVIVMMVGVLVGMSIVMSYVESVVGV